MSNSWALASNQRPNKTTPSRRASASLPLSSPLYVPLASKFFVTFSTLPSLPSSLVLSTPFLPTGFARVFHADDQHRQRLRCLTLPRRALHRMLENVSSSPSYRLSLPSPVSAYSFCSRLCHPFPRLSRCRMEITRETCRQPCWRNILVFSRR